MERILDIAVVGGGIAGLASASLLRDLGHTVTVFDQFKQPEPTGAGLIIQPVGQIVLDEVGVLGAALAHGVKIKELTGKNVENDKIALSARYDGSDVSQFGLGIHRGTLFSLMLKAAQARQISLVTDHRVFEANNPNDPYLRIEGNRQAGPFDLVVDASGAGSRMSPLIPVQLSYGALWGIVDLPDDERDLGQALRQRYKGARKMAGILPLGHLPGETGAKAAVFWSLKRSDYDSWREADIADWKAEVSEMWPDLGYLTSQFESHDDLTFATYSHGSLNKFYDGRVVFVGDAAHRASPQLGQGANMALLDASVLAETLAEYPVEKALAVYQQRRMWHLKTYQSLSFLMTPLYQSDRRLSGLLRDHIVTPFAQTNIGKKLISRVISGNLVAPFGQRRREKVTVEPARDILRGPGE